MKHRRGSCLGSLGRAVGVTWMLGVALGSSSLWAGQAEFRGFPKEFQWCVATAPHQIDGGNTGSDWWDWEQQTKPCRIRNCEKSGEATDHWNRVEGDTQLIADLGVQSYRLGVEWARLEPTRGQWDWAAVAHYRAELEGLEKRGIRPILTLQHFTLPRWVRDQGGWAWKEMPEIFARYAEFVAREVAPRVRDYVTINEPLVHLSGGYIVGLTPPGVDGGQKTPPDPRDQERWKKHVRFINSADECGDLSHPYLEGATPTKEAFERLVAPARGLLISHARAYRALHAVAREQRRSIRVGMAHHLRWMTPASAWNPFDQFLAGVVDQLWNWTIPDALKTGRLKISVPTIFHFEEKLDELIGTEDYIGVNYYTRDTVALVWDKGISVKLDVTDQALVNDMGWEIRAEGFYRVLRKAHARNPQLPVLILENGIADCTDRYRPQFLFDHLEALHRAIQKGVPVEAYCHWSLLDNFEWVEGFGPRFGLYAVDYKTQERTLRPSGRLFRQIAKDNGFYWGATGPLSIAPH